MHECARAHATCNIDCPKRDDTHSLEMKVQAEKGFKLLGRERRDFTVEGCGVARFHILNPEHCGSRA